MHSDYVYCLGFGQSTPSSSRSIRRNWRTDTGHVLPRAVRAVRQRDGRIRGHRLEFDHHVVDIRRLQCLRYQISQEAVLYRRLRAAKSHRDVDYRREQFARRVPRDDETKSNQRIVIFRFDLKTIKVSNLF